MRHAAAGNALMLKMATSASQLLHNSHTVAAQPAAVGMSPKRFPRVAGMGSGADGPACCARCWTLVSATPLFEGNTERRLKRPHPRLRADGASANPHVHSQGNQSGWSTHRGIPRLHPWEEVNRVDWRRKFLLLEAGGSASKPLTGVPGFEPGLWSLEGSRLNPVWPYAPGTASGDWTKGVVLCRSL